MLRRLPCSWNPSKHCQRSRQIKTEEANQANVARPRAAAAGQSGKRECTLNAKKKSPQAPITAPRRKFRRRFSVSAYPRGKRKRRPPNRRQGNGAEKASQDLSRDQESWGDRRLPSRGYGEYCESAPGYLSEECGTSLAIKAFTVESGEFYAGRPVSLEKRGTTGCGCGLGRGIRTSTMVPEPVFRRVSRPSYSSARCLMPITPIP